MPTHRLCLQPLSAFGTPLAGDTLFGQLCWTLRHQLGNDELTRLLDGYPSGQPFAVIGDALPYGHLPLPSLPSHFWQESTVDRKTLKKKRWLLGEHLDKPLSRWQALACNDAEALARIQTAFQCSNPTAKPTDQPVSERAQPHNTINRQTGTTDTGIFAPYSQSQLWYHPAMRFHLYVVLDEERLSRDALLQAMTHIGTSGYGRDASIGLGKFSITQEETPPLMTSSQGNAWLTLGPCAPQNLGFDPARSYYQPLTRFGRHGDMAVHSANPFKRPILLARTGGVFTSTKQTACGFIGQGLSKVSTSQPEAVHQGYAPVVPFHLPESCAS